MSDIRKYIDLMEKAMAGVKLYHGSNNNIDKFNLDFVSTNTGNDEYGVGIYLTDDYEVASGYGMYTYEVVLKSDITEVPDTGPDEDIARTLMKQAPDLEMTLTDWAEDPDQAFESALNAMTNTDSMEQMLDNIWYDFYRDEPKKFLINMVVETGFDYKVVEFDNGVKFIVLFNPKMIESKRLVDEEDIK